MTEEEYIQKGFNAGYQLQHHEPKIAEQIQQSFTDQSHPYAQGFIAGSQEYEKEKGINNNLLSKYMNKTGKNEKENSKGLEDNENDLER